MADGNRPPWVIYQVACCDFITTIHKADDLTLLDCRLESAAVDNYSGQDCEHPDIDLSITTWQSYITVEAMESTPSRCVRRQRRTKKLHIIVAILPVFNYTTLSIIILAKQVHIYDALAMMIFFYWRAGALCNYWLTFDDILMSSQTK